MRYERLVFDEDDLKQIQSLLNLEEKSFSEIKNDGYFSLNRYDLPLVGLNQLIISKMEEDKLFTKTFLPVNTYFIRLFSMKENNYVAPFVNTSNSDFSSIIVIGGEQLDIQINDLNTQNLMTLALKPGYGLSFKSDTFIGYTSKQCYFVSMEHVSKFNDNDINLIYSDLFAASENINQKRKLLSVEEAESDPLYLISRAMQRLENRFDMTSKMRLFANFKREA